ncbi:MAG TPA: hypothetical protein VK541_17290 [Pedobacter sp.]|jgi:hypothetical protein|uniref:hypothetical protein n=1 Tax=Pedobacter TaxID=84567 RepID=UPI00254F83A1|nr:MULTISPECIES: hypothetical protein [Pedobacter]HMI04246.1 hypothetical protein [Pedobacter sp.]
MMETSTSVNKLNYEQSKQQEMLVEDLEAHDIVFYENIKTQLDGLSRNPSDETVSKILAYSRAK